MRGQWVQWSEGGAPEVGWEGEGRSCVAVG